MVRSWGQPGKHESLLSPSGKPGPSQTDPAPEDRLLLPHSHSLCHTAIRLDAQPCRLSALLHTFLLYVPPFLSLSGPLRFGLLPFLKGRMEVRRDGETTSTDLGI